MTAEARELVEGGGWLAFWQLAQKEWEAKYNASVAAEYKARSELSEAPRATGSAYPRVRAVRQELPGVGFLLLQAVRGDEELLTRLGRSTQMPWRTRFRRPSVAPMREAISAVQAYAQRSFERFSRAPYIAGRCNICGNDTLFFCDNKALYRESLNCAECRATSRYRSIARGVLRAVEDLAGVRAGSLAALPGSPGSHTLRIYDAQLPFVSERVAYPIPEILARCSWIELHSSRYDPDRPWGEELSTRVTNQNLEALTFPDAFFDVVITSDVMEHVRLDDRAHREIGRVVRPGGVYLFTVPHFRHQVETFGRVEVVDPEDPSKDEFLTEPEYHGDPNSPDGKALSYRSYGTELDRTLESLGFGVQYTKEDFPELGIMNTELFYCRRR